jgi:hypothetical protein
MLRHATLLSEKVLTVLPTIKENYEYVQGVTKYSSEKEIVIPFYDEMQLGCELLVVEIFFSSNIRRVLYVVFFH